MVEIEDLLYKTSQMIRCKYLFGADGANSRVVQQLGLPLKVNPSQGIALNVLLRADLSDIMKTRVGNLHYVVQPEKEMPNFASWSIMRMVKPWYEWLLILMYSPTCPADFMPTQKQVQDQAMAVIGDSTIPINILRIDKWVINETVAESYSKGRVYAAPSPFGNPSPAYCH
jgi:2-polyprenyl-6-methoxyphenol hydroxylase-like FAD-dependent oxidoreductase